MHTSDTDIGATILHASKPGTYATVQHAGAD